MTEHSKPSETVVEIAKTRVILLDDLPANEDKFGPHQRVADAIVDLVIQESGGKAIAIEGGWGTGKSTVIQLIQSKLNALDDFHVIQFDAWSHKGDPLRRTYLETVIRSLQENGWVDKRKWDLILAQISNRTKISRTRLNPSTTALGTIFGISVLLVPIGGALMAVAARLVTSKTGLDIAPDVLKSSHFLYLASLGLFLLLSPLLVLIGNLILLPVLNSLIWMVNRFRKKSPISHRSLSFSFLTGNSVKETESETTESPNPTSIEFEDFFGRVMTDSVGKDKNKRVILVLDNLDRVDSQSALELWSTLRTFLQDQTHGSPIWSRQLWTLVPYDPAAISNHWEDAPQSEAAACGTTTGSFLDKSFQIRFAVPRPVLSDWKAFLMELLTAAFPDHDEDDFHMAYRVYDDWKRKSKQSPAPRDLKLFVNQIGAVVRQWGREFPFSHVAYFVLHCREVDPAIIRLQSGEIPDIDSKRLLGDSLVSSLAGMLFNTSPKKAMELLLGDKISDALFDVNAENFLALAVTHGEGFWAVFESRITQDARNAELKWLGAVCRSINSIDGQDRLRIETKTVLQELKNSILASKESIPITKSSAEDCVAILELFKDANVTQHILTANRDSLKMEAEPVTANAVAETAIAYWAIYKVAKDLNMVGIGDDFSLSVPCDAEDWIRSVSEILSLEGNSEIFDLVASANTSVSIAQRFAEYISTGAFDDTHLVALECTGPRLEEASLKLIFDSIDPRAQSATNMPAKDVEPLVKAILSMESFAHESSEECQKLLVSRGDIAHQFHACNAIAKGKAACAFLILKQDPMVINRPNVGNSIAGYTALTQLLAGPDDEFISEILRLISEVGMEAKLREIFENRGLKDPFTLALINQLGSTVSCAKVYSNEFFLKHWRGISEALKLETDFNDLLKLLSEENSFCEFLICESDGFTAGNSSLYWQLLEVNLEDESLRSWCKSGLESMNHASWLADFKDDFDAFWLSVKLAESGTTIALSTPVLDALDEHARLLVSNDTCPDQIIVDEWHSFLSLIDVADRNALMKRLLQTAVAANGQLSGAFFTLYGDTILNPAALKENNGSILNLFSPIVKDSNIPGLRHLVKFAKANGGFLQGLDGALDSEEFVNRIQNRLAASTTSEADELVSQLAQIWGIKASIPTEGGDEKASESGT